MPFIMQVKVKVPGLPEPMWRDVHATHESEPYSYETEEEASRMLRMCYPGTTADEARVLEVPAKG